MLQINAIKNVPKDGLLKSENVEVQIVEYPVKSIEIENQYIVKRHEKNTTR
jgi:hypothetical protein